MKRFAWLLACLVALGATPAFAAKPEEGGTPTPAEIQRLEHERDRKPNAEERRDALGIAYYRFARAAFDRGDVPEYLKYLEMAMQEWIQSLRIDPKNPTPHVFMGIVAAYQGKIDDALDDFYNARELAPGSGTSYTNVAETMIYAGRDSQEVETWLSRGERMGVDPAIVELNFCLLRWRDGKADDAAKRFYRALRMNPEVVRTWNEAPVSNPIQTFDELTKYCCGSPACGPYLARACAAASEPVAHRELPEEAALRELRIEMERRRELDRIYRENKDVQIRVKKPEDVATPTPAPGTSAAPSAQQQEAKP